MLLPELAAWLIQRNHDVLVSDVCTLLDVIRGVYRDNGRDIIETALVIDSQIQVQSLPFSLVLPSLFAGEWQDNVVKVKGELDQKLNQHWRLSQELIHLHQRMRRVPLAMPNVTQLGLGEKLERSCNRLIASAEVIEPEDRFDVAAMLRVLQQRAPSSQGKPEPKDCRIFEETLALGRELKQQGFTHKIIFASSNTKEYGSNLIPNPEIESDLLGIGGLFAQSLNYAYYLAVTP